MFTKNFKAHIACEESGSTIVEFVFILIMLLFLTIGTAVTGLTFATWGILNKGAHIGINAAIKIDNIDLPEEDDQLFRDAFNKVEDETRSFPLGTGIYNDNDEVEFELLRPGDDNHPTCDATCAASESLASLLKDHPIVIRLTAPAPFSFPLIGLDDLELSAVAMGFRENG